MADYTSIIDQAAANNSVPASWVSQIVSIESSGNPNAVSSTGVQGLAQITKGTWNQLYPGVPYSTDPTSQINAAAALMGNYYATYNQDPALAALAYNAGPGVANLAQSYMSQGQSSAQAVQNAVANYQGPDGSHLSAAKQAEALGEVSKFSGKLTGDTPNSTAQATFVGGVDDSSVPQLEAISGEIVSGDTSAIVNSTTYIVQTGLDAPAWYSDPNLVVNNPRLKSTFRPIRFEVQFPTGKFLGTDDQHHTKLYLNASLKTYEIVQSHSTIKTPTRAGLMLTLWGQQADLFTGTASTGAFMNQLGLTQFLSTATVSAELKAFISHSLIGNLAKLDGYNTVSGVKLNALANQTSGLRVAAEDCFMEFLALFKNNGVVYYTPVADTKTTAWSSSTGLNNEEIFASLNDVKTRGSVVMYMDNVDYHGYFKSLTWKMNAEKPFSWDFDFVFQVERTYTREAVPIS